ncbi:hypothetical protein KG102_12050 [Cellulomonas fengjieae]|uniref:hypothetical protein n=1 Tax=Cellulomonas fengjieae TaxID=2819978 RepID=UPI001BD0E4C5|nr:hypothetical protein [Cellulomonas fengjieae]QVI64885.1 hypothetical protein KG102_12050 [Cellulomonas fengjieae]
MIASAVPVDVGDSYPTVAVHVPGPPTGERSSPQEVDPASGTAGVVTLAVVPGPVRTSEHEPSDSTTPSTYAPTRTIPSADDQPAYVVVTETAVRGGPAGGLVGATVGAVDGSVDGDATGAVALGAVPPGVLVALAVGDGDAGSPRSISGAVHPAPSSSVTTAGAATAHRPVTCREDCRAGKVRGRHRFVMARSC